MSRINSGMSRRSFIGWIATAVPATRVLHAALPSSVELDHQTLVALATALLPTELGRAGLERTAREFASWVRGYRPDAELLHSYGDPVIRRAGESPAARWSLQLAELRRDHFAQRPLAERRAIAREQLANDKLDRMPSIASARHVAAGLLAFFYDSPAATDLCYRARIARNACRPLGTSARKPLPLADDA